jgi:toxin ParE1/3/4
MPLLIRFHPEALLELKDGASFYGERFVDQVGDALALIAEMPHTWPMWPGRTDLHRRVVKKVPYAIVYAIDRTSIFVVAVEHTKRRPGYWLGRI